jgi:mannose-6-phosphate isomerase-like protein (cupin superfamily)
MDIKNLAEVSAFITKDGSEIRELLAHRNSGIRNQSLAEARLPIGASTQEHFHPRAEEIYFITHGVGRIKIENEMRDVQAGDAIAIPPGKNISFGTRERQRFICFVVARRLMSTVTLSLPKNERRARQSRLILKNSLRETINRHSRYGRRAHAGNLDCRRR